MILSDEVSQSEPLGWTGVETGWNTGVKALAVEHVSAVYTDALDVAAPLSRNVHYGLTIAASGLVAAVPLAMPAAPGTIVFTRNTPAVKPVEFINLATYLGEVHDVLYTAMVMRAAELRRDLLAGADVNIIVAAEDVTFADPDFAAINAGDALRELFDGLALKSTIGHNHALADLSDVEMAPGAGSNQWRVTWDNGIGRFVLAPSLMLSGAETVALINTELGGTGWQAGGGGGGGGDITGASNVGTGGELGLFKAKSGVQLQFYGIRGVTGVAVALNVPLNGYDISFDAAWGDARYAKLADLDNVAFSGAYADLSGLPALGALAFLGSVAWANLGAGAIATLAEATAGAANKLVPASVLPAAVAALAPAATVPAVGGDVLCPHEGLSVLYASAITVSVVAAAVLLKASATDVKRYAGLNLLVAITLGGANGLDSGAEVVSRWYHIWAIGKADGTVAGLLSASPTTPILPIGYIYQGYLGAVYNNAAGNFVPFFQQGDQVACGGSAIVAGAAVAYTAVSLAALVPPTAKVVEVDAQHYTTTGGGVACEAKIAAAGAGTTSTYGDEIDIFHNSGMPVNQAASGHGALVLTTAQQLAYYVSGAGAKLTIRTRGWHF